jgi:Tol biopolymer transport system component
MQMRNEIVSKTSILLLLLVLPLMVSAQYFGQNKPRYQQFDFEVLETPNFEIYHYLEEPTKLSELASWSEQWYAMHRQVLPDTFGQLNPIIFYNHHAEFRQTNTISGQIRVGTGGVTEAFKNRVIMPIAFSNQQTWHVLGHEMVHAIQYNLVLNGDSTSIQNLANLPLWLVEGLAEYLSIGRVDAHTAMWMRDAVLQGDIPTLKDLSNPKYFPYRYGQAFWAFLTGLYGDDKIEPFFMATAQYGFTVACDSVLGVTAEQLSNLWVEGLQSWYGPYVEDRREKPQGRRLIDADQGGRINVAPVISPNGKYIIFLSERNLFSTDLFLADARTGEILQQVTSVVKEGDVDDIEYIESAGTWSPDSREFAFVTVEKGRNVLVIKEAQTGKTVREIRPEGLTAFQNPSWSPDGKTIVFTGLQQGQADLYLLDIASEKWTKLTNDRYSEILPNWSPDGRFIVAATDRLSFGQQRSFGKWPFSITIFEVASGTAEDLNFFPGADNLNPVYDQHGNILFLSNRDGFRNLYQYEPATGKVYQQTEVLTGISGITQYAPAISTSRNDRRDRIAYSHYYENGYRIYLAKPEDFLRREVSPDSVDLSPAILPTLNRRAPNIVQENLEQLSEEEVLPEDQLSEKPYRPQFRLDYMGGGAGVGIGNSNMGTVSGAAGGVDFLFSDMLGHNQLFTSLSLNGEFTDVGGVVAYRNQKGRISWGVSLSHLPSRFGIGSFGNLDTLTTDNGEPYLVLRDDYDVLRIFTDEIGVFAQLPFSQTLRLEAGLAYSFLYDRLDRTSYYYDGYFLLGRERNRIDTDEFPINVFTGQIAQFNTAIVGDNSFFGLTAPLQGYRFRVGTNVYRNGFGERVKEFGGANFYSLTADFRRYVYLKPVSLAVRGMHIGRYGEDSDNFNPTYIGFPWFVRGYNSVRASEVLAANGYSTQDLLGSKVFVSNFEVRVPFTGPERLALIKSKLFFSDLNFFVDGGIAWDDFSELGIPGSGEGNPKLEAKPFFSAGASVRINLFGALILEPYYAFPLMKDTRGVFGLNIQPGW